MNLVKLSVAAFAFVFFVSCGESAPTQNSKNIVPNTASVKSTNAAPNNAAKKNPEVAADVDDLEPTDDLYAQNCMICHQATGKGGKVTIKGKNLNAEDLTTEKMKKHSDEKLFAYISDGVPDEGMPAFKGKLSDDQIKTLVAHVRELQSK
ncbi:MAG: c-type cytochrome [Pyrinomonadaceae bacterium]